MSGVGGPKRSIGVNTAGRVIEGELKRDLAVRWLEGDLEALGEIFWEEGILRFKPVVVIIKAFNRQEEILSSQF